MNTDQLSRDLKEAASSWTTPTFDSADLRALATTRQRRTRHRVMAAALGTLLIVAAVTVTRLEHHSGRTVPKAESAPPTRSRPALDNGVAPAAPPPVRITALDTTGGRLDRQPVLARTPTGTSVTVRARLHFVDNRPGQVRNTAVVIVAPGTPPAAAPSGTGNYYKSTRVAISARVDATSPQQRILAVSTPADLRPGNYPVLSVIRTVLLPGQKQGVQGPFAITGEVGIITVTSP